VDKKYSYLQQLEGSKLYKHVNLLFEVRSY